MSRQLPAQAEVQGVWRQALELSDRDQLQLYAWLRDYIAAGPGQPTEADPEMAQRVRALEAMERAAEHHGLPPGRAPTVAQYKQAHAALRLPVSSEQVIRWWGFWRTAKTVFEGGRTPPTAKQLGLARTTSGKRRRYVDYIAGVQMWLDSHPGSYTDDNYDAFVEDHNRARPGGATPLVSSPAIREGLAIGWAEVLGVAHGELDLEQAREAVRRKKDARRGERGLVGAADIALMLDIRKDMVTHYARRADFPPPAATIAGRRVWPAKDVESYRDGSAPDVARSENDLQKHLMDSSELARTLGYKPDSLRTAINQRHWHRVPEPAGQVSGAHYWERADIDKWRAKRGHSGRGKRA